MPHVRQSNRTPHNAATGPISTGPTEKSTPAVAPGEIWQQRRELPDSLSAPLLAHFPTLAHWPRPAPVSARRPSRSLDGPTRRSEKYVQLVLRAANRPDWPIGSRIVDRPPTAPTAVAGPCSGIRSIIGAAREDIKLIGPSAHGCYETVGSRRAILNMPPPSPAQIRLPCSAHGPPLCIGDE